MPEQDRRDIKKKSEKKKKKKKKRKRKIQTSPDPRRILPNHGLPPSAKV
jgi:hypothetical protein